jgi:hypothetical protein
MITWAYPGPVHRGGPGWSAYGARRNGKARAARMAVEAAAQAGQHVHAAGPGGVWCVTWHPGVGYLWARLARAGRHPAGSCPGP